MSRTGGTLPQWGFIAGAVALLALARVVPAIRFAESTPSNLEARRQVVGPEGYITTDDGVRLYYQILGSGAPTLVAGHFPFIEVPDAFFSAARTFLDGDWPAESEALDRRR